MSLSLLDIYNKVTAQSWSIYETDLSAADELEKSVIIAIQKALRVLWNSHNYCFRLKNKKFVTIPKQALYVRPDGNIIQDGIKLVDFNQVLEPIHFSKLNGEEYGVPKYFYVKYNKLGFFPVPENSYNVSVDYNTFKLGKNAQNQSIYNLNDLSDVLDVPEMFEDLFLHALLNKSMLNALASGKSELYQPYLQQFVESYKNLVLNTSGVDLQKEIKW